MEASSGVGKRDRIVISEKEAWMTLLGLILTGASS
jgi:hypothetical protein